MFALRKYTDKTYTPGVVSGLKAINTNYSGKYNVSNKNRAKLVLGWLSARKKNNGTVFNYTHANIELKKIKADAELRAARKQAIAKITSNYVLAGRSGVAMRNIFKNALSSAPTVNAVRNIVNKSNRLSNNLKNVAQWFTPQPGYPTPFTGYVPKNNSNTKFKNNMIKLRNKYYNTKTINSLNELVASYQNILRRSRSVR
jgi:hypothetical protein